MKSSSVQNPKTFVALFLFGLTFYMLPAGAQQPTRGKSVTTGSDRVKKESVTAIYQYNVVYDDIMEREARALVTKDKDLMKLFNTYAEKYRKTRSWGNLEADLKKSGSEYLYLQIPWFSMVNKRKLTNVTGNTSSYVHFLHAHGTGKDRKLILGNVDTWKGKYIEELDYKEAPQRNGKQLLTLSFSYREKGSTKNTKSILVSSEVIKLQ